MPQGQSDVRIINGGNNRQADCRDAVPVSDDIITGYKIYIKYIKASAMEMYMECTWKCTKKRIHRIPQKETFKSRNISNKELEYHTV